MLEEQKTWKREAGFDQIEIIAEMHAQRLHAGLDSEPLYTGMYNRRWLRTPEESKLDMDVDVERLRLEILLSQATPSPQDDLLPRRSPAVSTGSDEPGVPHTETQQTEPKEILVPMALCTLIAKVLNRRLLLFHFKQTSGWMTRKKLLQHNKSLLARSSRDRRKTGSSEGRQDGVSSKPSSLIREGDGIFYYFADVLPCVCFALPFLCSSCVFF